ncbi:uncharacterized protein LOC130621506 [Hydractinia symbiolongicarpus]|uniref:uncharacterized protein LOC130621506 n=1 Tax=Hydractinia symbiolongicarpus TaxID=13093 RepID=UPI00254D580B|nr:uncharacterized protein LOC130621506 [Hydractinia symbiolongicarpus]
MSDIDTSISVKGTVNGHSKNTGKILNDDVSSYHSAVEDDTISTSNDSGVTFPSIENLLEQNESVDNNLLTSTSEEDLVLENTIPRSLKSNNESDSPISDYETESSKSLVILSSSHFLTDSPANTTKPLDARDTSCTNDAAIIDARDTSCTNDTASINARDTSCTNDAASINARDTSCTNDAASINKSFIKQLIRDAYKKDGADMYDGESNDTWQPRAQSSPARKATRQKILIRELSFDELQDVQGIDLMAPVFLAVTDDADDNVNDLRRKAKSIEDLCSTTYDDGLDFRQRSRSELPPGYKDRKKRITSPAHDTNFYNYEDSDTDYSIDDAKSRLTSLSVQSNASFDDDINMASVSDQYNESLDDSLEERAIMDVFINNGMYDEADVEAINAMDENNLDALKRMNESLIFGEQNSTKSSVATYDDEKHEKSPRPNSLNLAKGNDTDLNMTPVNVSATASGFWEYPCTDSPVAKSPSFANYNRQLSFNTSPKSSMVSTSVHDRFIVVSVAGQQKVVDMQLIEPYLKVLSHGGHHRVGTKCHVLVVFTACYLPTKYTDKYHIIMEQLFYYFVHAVNLLVTDTYEIVYFTSAVDGKNMPSHAWIKQCYDMLEYRLKKSLQVVYFVHQSIWLKTILRFSKLFVSSKFRRKIRFIKNIKTLQKHIPLEYIFIPPEIHQIDKRFS